MVALIKSTENLTAKLVAVCALNVTDILFTLALQHTGVFSEANPVMALLINSTATALIVKLTAPAALAAVLIVRLRRATPGQRKTANVLICALLAFYMLVNLSHIVWSTAYFAFQAFA